MPASPFLLAAPLPFSQRLPNHHANGDDDNQNCRLAIQSLVVWYHWGTICVLEHSIGVFEHRVVKYRVSKDSSICLKIGVLDELGTTK